MMWGQFGEVQAIGGVNEKVEGYFDVCQVRGLTGDQGVLVPATNVKHLMLKNEVVQAVKEGKFHIHAIANIDEGIETLTGKSAGERDSEGNYPADTVNFLVEEKLKLMAKVAHEHEEHEKS